MSIREAIERTREILDDPDSAPSERDGIVGALAIAVIADAFNEEETDEARQIILGFWHDLAVRS